MVRVHTLDHLADTDLRLEVTTADRGVEPAKLGTESVNSSGTRERSGFNILVALVVGLGLVLEPAGVLNSDSLADLGNGAGALLRSSLGDTHSGEAGGESSGGAGCES